MFTGEGPIVPVIVDMRFWILFVLMEAGLLGLVIALSHTRAREDAVVDAGPVRAVVSESGTRIAQRSTSNAFAAAIQSARNGFERRLAPGEKAADLGPGLQDAILRMEGMFDPTRIRVFGGAMRMRVRPGTASMTGVFGYRWTRLSAEPNLHRRVRYIAEGWLAARVGSCGDLWMFRPGGSAVMLDSLTPSECSRLRFHGSTDPSPANAPVVAARLSLPAFAAPYPGNRLAPEGLRAEQAARIWQVQQNRWFNSRGQPSMSGVSRL